MQTCAVIVAAGMSSRMGDFKPMLNVGSISIAQRVITTLRQCGIWRIVVVTGHNADMLERHLSNNGLVFVRNPDYATTDMFESAKIGMRYIQGKCDRFLFTPVDIPLFTAATVEALLKSDAKLACPCCDGRRGHPILISAELIPAILSDSGENGLHGALGRLDAETELIQVPDQGVLMDADTAEDYSTILKYHNRQLSRPVVSLAIARELPFFDEKVALLLQLIDETGSVSTACKNLKISYSGGWNRINLLESQLAVPLVIRSQGGARGGKSSLTEYGKKFLIHYRALLDELQKQADVLYEKHFGDLL